MSNTVESLLIRNLRDVFAEHDAERRTAVIEELFHPDCIFSDPRGRHVGRRQLDRAIGDLQSQFPDYVFSTIGAADVLEDSGRLAWAFGPDGDPRRITGLDVVVVSADRIAALYTFLDPIPPVT
ncbi:nuclear transport factor 2 family protein [Sphingomonas sp. PB4P5]|uniref:nuclear transport factor 2 family protein n=1 Tax=Parasphingomonas puruogangriensis TaxID=3096155 RepID=UPI002FCBA8ED